MPLKESGGLTNKQHAVPQNIMQVEFKIIGDLTMRQFFYLVLAAIFAFGMLKSGLPGYVAFPISLAIALSGAAIAFVPIQDRGMDQWVAFFFQAIYKPTQRVWKKETIIPQYFLYQSAALLKTEMLAIAPTASRRKLEEYLERETGELKKKDKLDETEEEFFKKVRVAFEKNRAAVPQGVMRAQSASTTYPQTRTTERYTTPQTYPVPEIPVYKAPTLPKRPVDSPKIYEPLPEEDTRVEPRPIPISGVPDSVPTPKQEFKPVEPSIKEGVKVEVKPIIPTQSTTALQNQPVTVASNQPAAQLVKQPPMQPVAQPVAQTPEIKPVEIAREQKPANVSVGEADPTVRSTSFTSTATGGSTIEHTQLVRPARPVIRQNFPQSSRIQGSRAFPGSGLATGVTGRRFTNLTPSQGEIVLPIRGERILRTSDEPEPQKTEVETKMKNKIDQLNALVEKLKTEQKAGTPTQSTRLSIPPLNIANLGPAKKEEKQATGNPFVEVSGTATQKQSGKVADSTSQQQQQQSQQALPSQQPQPRAGVGTGSMYLPPEKLVWTGPEPMTRKPEPKQETEPSETGIIYDEGARPVTNEDLEKHLKAADDKLSKQLDDLNKTLATKSPEEQVQIQEQIKKVEAERDQSKKTINQLESKVKELEQKLTQNETPKVVVQKVVEKIQVPVIHDLKPEAPAQQAVAPVVAKIPQITSTPNAINGVVKDPNGRLVDGAVIMLKDPRGDVVRALRTNKLGQFLITTPVPNGSYIVEVSYERDNVILSFDRVTLLAKGEVLPPIEITGKI